MYLEIKCTGEAPPRFKPLVTRSQGMQMNKDKQVLHFIYDPSGNFLSLCITSDHSSLHVESHLEWSICGYICELFINFDVHLFSKSPSVLHNLLFRVPTIFSFSKSVKHKYTQYTVKAICEQVHNESITVPR